MILLSKPNMIENSLTSSNSLLRYYNIFGLNYYPVGSIFPNYLKKGLLKFGLFEQNSKLNTLHFLNLINCLNTSPPYSTLFFMPFICSKTQSIVLLSFPCSGFGFMVLLTMVFPPCVSQRLDWNQVKFFIFIFLLKFFRVSSGLLLLCHPLMSSGLSIREIQIDQGLQVILTSCVS